MNKLVVAWLAVFNSPETVRMYTKSVEGFLTWTEQQGLALFEVRRADVTHWFAEMVDTGQWAPPTLNQRLSAVSSLYRFALDQGLAPFNPCDRVPRLPETRELKLRPLSSVKARRLLDVAREDSPRSTVLVGGLHLNGLRISEVTGLTHEGLHPGAAGVRAEFRAFGGGKAEVILAPTIVQAVEQLPHREGPLLMDGKGKRMGRGTAAAILDRLSLIAGVGHVSSDQLRMAGIRDVLDKDGLAEGKEFSRHKHAGQTWEHELRRRGSR